MKKGKVIGRGHIAVIIMLLALGAAVWLNMRFSSDKYLGEAKYVDNSSGEAVETSAKVPKDETDYFKEASKEKEKTYGEITDEIEDITSKDNISAEDKEALKNLATKFANRKKQENNIESLLKAKGFKQAVAVIGDKNINIVVKSDGLTTTQTLQIQDVVTGETDIEIENIKIVAIK